MALSRQALVDQWLLRQARNTDFEEAVRGRRFRNQETNRMDLFVSLPPAQQQALRGFFQKNREQGEQGQQGSQKGPGYRERVHGALRGAKKFFTDRDFRNEVLDHLQEKAKDFKNRLKQEMHESADMARTLTDIVRGRPVSDEDRKAATEQLVDVAKMAFIGAAAVTPIPGAKFLPWLLTAAVNRALHKKYSIAPSAWRTASDEADQVIHEIWSAILDDLSHPDEHLYEVVMAQAKA